MATPVIRQDDLQRIIAERRAMIERAEREGLDEATVAMMLAELAIIEHQADHEKHYADLRVKPWTGRK